MRRLLGVGVLGAALLLVPVAVAATPGTYDGWLYKKNGERWKGSVTTLTVRDYADGQRFRLSVYNMRLGCPYLDRNGNQAKARMRFVFRNGRVDGARIDATESFPRRNPTHRIRVRGGFAGGRFIGRIRVSSAPGIAGACTGSASVRVRR